MSITHESTRRTLFKLGDTRGPASLPCALDLRESWRVWGPRLVEKYGKVGWLLFMLDAQEKLTEVMVMLSRSIRNRTARGGEGWTAKEWENIQEVTAEASAWFNRHCPDPNSVPEEIGFMLTSQYGLFRVLTRVGRELRAIQEQGYSTVVLETGENGIQVTQGGDRFLKEVA